MKRARRIGAQLGGWIALSTGLSLLTFVLTAAAVYWWQERDELAMEGAAGIAGEIAEQIGVALMVALPVALLTAVVATRVLTRRIATRLDGVAARAEQASASNLSVRFETGSRGDELDHLANSLNQLFVRIEHGIASQRQFAADASHELRGPLAALSMSLEVAQRRERTPDEWSLIASGAREEVERMVALVESLLSLTRAERPLVSERISLANLVSELVKRKSSLSTTVRSNSATAEEISVDGDPRALELCLDNLITNACRYSPPDAEVMLMVGGDANLAWVTVDDQGPGVPLARRDAVFEPFVRGTSGGADQQGHSVGLGLGLAIAKRVALAHHGELAVTDSPSGGARFQLTLPRT